MRMRLFAAIAFGALMTPAQALPTMVVDAPAPHVSRVLRSLPYPYTSQVPRARHNPEMRAFRRCMRANYGPNYYFRVSTQRRYLMARVCGM